MNRLTADQQLLRQRPSSTVCSASSQLALHWLAVPRHSLGGLSSGGLRPRPGSQPTNHVPSDPWTAFIPGKGNHVPRMGIACSAVTMGVTSVGASVVTSTPWLVWAALIVAATAGMWAEKTKIGKELSGALVGTLVGMLFANTGIIPPGAPELGIVYKYLLPLAIPMLLMSADLKRILGETGRMLAAFLLGSVCTVAGSLIAYSVFPLGPHFGADGWKIAAALTARHIGGAVNYMAVADTVNLSPTVFGAGLAADDLILTLYFTSIFSLAKGILSDTEKARADRDIASSEPASAPGAALGSASVSAPSSLAALGSASVSAPSSLAALGSASVSAPSSLAASVPAAASAPSTKFTSASPPASASDTKYVSASGTSYASAPGTTSTSASASAPAPDTASSTTTEEGRGASASASHVAPAAASDASDASDAAPGVARAAGSVHTSASHVAPAAASAASHASAASDAAPGVARAAGSAHTSASDTSAASDAVLGDSDAAFTAARAAGSGAAESCSVEELEELGEGGQPTSPSMYKPIMVLEGITALATSAVICHTATCLATYFSIPGHTITLITAFTVMLATSVPRLMTPLVPSAQGLARILMQIFCAAIGASANVELVVRNAPALFLFSALALSLHVVLLLGAGKVLGFSRQELLLASNANIGGPSTVAGLATAKGWTSVMVPSILVSTLGYAIGTFVGMAVGHTALSKMG